MPTKTSAHRTSAGSGRTHHSIAIATTQTAEKNRIHGLRRPDRSATAPKTGPDSAMARADRLIAAPHWAVPVTSSTATALVK